MTDLSPDVQGLLDESYESDLTEEESERLLLMCGHGIGPKLSPAAQAVLDAYWTLADLLDREVSHGEMIAAALRAAADAVTPAPPDSKPGTSPLLKAIRWERNTTREQLLTIAAELEANA